MEEDRNRGEKKHRRIHAILAVVKLVLWILWVLFDPRHPF